MEEYKRRLYYLINPSTSEGNIYDSIKDDSRYTCNNEDGLLHSNYNGTHYEPAIIYSYRGRITYYWLFDGKIKDCEHPYRIDIFYGQVADITYCSSARINADQPIYINNSYMYGTRKAYNMSFNHITSKHTKILEDDSCKYGDEIISRENCDKDLFTPEWYPLCDEMNELNFKLAD